MVSVGVGGHGVAFSAQLLKPHEVAWIPARIPVPSRLLDLFLNPTHQFPTEGCFGHFSDVETEA